MEYTYQPVGVCSRLIKLEIVDGIIQSAQFLGGCSGNTQGLSALVAGQPVDEVIHRLRGIRCGGRASSCPDQLACALEQAKAQLTGG